MKKVSIVVVLLILAYPVLAQIGTHAVLRLIPHTFADISMADTMPQEHPVADGGIAYCSDCKVPATPGAKCAAGGPGAEAHRIRGQWSCF